MEPRIIRLTLEPPAERLDKALAAVVPEGAGLSRSRLRALIEGGAVTVGGAVITDPKAKLTGSVEIDLPPPAPAEALPEDIPLVVVYEDADLIVIDKPAGMVVHPAPGAETGTLVNTLLHHCGTSLRGVGGVGRPGIVHRIDKDTSGLLVVAKTDAAHQGLSAQFAAHDIERVYDALCWGVPSAGDPRLRGLAGVTTGGKGLRIETGIDRHRADRKKMAVAAAGRRAVTHVSVAEQFGVAARVECRLETGRTHQIRVHMAFLGHALIGDPVYGGARKSGINALSEAAKEAVAALPGQALHAGVLGFKHPVSGGFLRFRADPPDAFNNLLTELRQHSPDFGAKTP